MKTIFAFIFVILLAISCHEANESSMAASKLNANVGHQILPETAERWIGFYNSKNVNGREGITYKISGEQLGKILLGSTNNLGVIFHHAIDDAGVSHILVTSIGEDVALWNSSVVVDANSNSLIENEVSKRWAKKYEDAHPGEVWYHFFGANMFKEITSNANFNYFDIAGAFNDDNQPQLILLVWNNKTDAAGGRTKDEGPIPYDASHPCPPCAGTN
jgi:hypothetical protein